MHCCLTEAARQFAGHVYRLGEDVTRSVKQRCASARYVADGAARRDAASRSRRGGTRSVDNWNRFIFATLTPDQMFLPPAQRGKGSRTNIRNFVFQSGLVKFLTKCNVLSEKNPSMNVCIMATPSYHLLLPLPNIAP